MQLSEPSEAASGSGRLFANALDVSKINTLLILLAGPPSKLPNPADLHRYVPLQLVTIGALLGDAVLVRVWPADNSDQQWTFLCTACSFPQGVSECARFLLIASSATNSCDMCVHVLPAL